MKITFNDKSFIDISKSDNPGKIVVSISAKDGLDPLRKITNAVEITVEQFKELVSGIL